MPFIHKFIAGTPYSDQKTRGNVQAPKDWTNSIIDQTKSLPIINDECGVKITFLLPANKFPTDLPHGSDLDNLTKRFLDALNETIFRKAEGKDSCVISLHVTKTKVEPGQEPGAWLEVLPLPACPAC